METREFQKKCAHIVEEIDRKYNINRSPQLSFTQFIEEVGELAKDVNFPKLRNKEADRDNLSGEFADVFMQLCILAELHKIDIEEATEKKMAVLREKNGLDASENKAEKPTEI